MSGNPLVRFDEGRVGRTSKVSPSLLLYREILPFLNPTLQADSPYAKRRLSSLLFDSAVRGAMLLARAILNRWLRRPSLARLSAAKPVRRGGTEHAVVTL